MVILTKTWFKFILLIVFAVVMVIMCRYVKKNSYYDLDIVLYTACAIEDKGDSPEQLHQKTYALAKKDLNPEIFERYIDTSRLFRRSIYEHPENFYSQLPFYRIKPLYVALLSMAYHSGFSPFYFSTFLNIICYLLISIIVLFYLIRHVGFYQGYLSSLCMLLLPILLDTVKSNTPDILAALFTLISILFFISHKRSLRVTSLVLFAVLIFTRPENILLVLSLCAICLLLNLPDYSKKFIVALILVSSLSYITVVFAFKAYAWSLLYKHSFIGYIPDLQNVNHGIGIKDYLLGLRMLPNSLFYSDFFLIILLLLFPLFIVKREKNILHAIIYSFLACMLFRLLIFPDFANRFYVGYFIVSFIVFIRLLTQVKPILQSSNT